MQFIHTNINTVHAALLDSFWGFKECAAVVPDSRLKEKFEKIAFERQRMIRELEIRGGASKSTSGSMTGGLTRTWTKIKSSLSSGGVQHVLDDLAQEEASLRKTYDNALKSPAVDSALNGLLITHLRNIECHLSELRIICGEAKYSHKWDIATPSTTEVLKEKLQTTGQTISTKLSTTGATLKDKMASTGQTISTKFSSSGAVIKDKFSTSGAVIKDKLGFGQTHTETVDNMVEPSVNDTDTYPPTTVEQIKDKLPTMPTGQQIKDAFPTGQQVKEKLQTTGTSIKENLQTTGTTIKDKLGMGQTQQQQTEFHTVNTTSDFPQL